MNLADIQNAQSIAGARFCAAANELRASVVELAALDQVLSNRNINEQAPVMSFSDAYDALNKIVHPVFGPTIPKCRVADEIAQRRDILILEYKYPGL